MEDKTVYEDWLVTRECVNNDIVRMVLSCVTVSAVFDGHGGGECSEYLEGRFVERIRRGIGECEGVGEIWKAVERRERSGDFEEVRKRGGAKRGGKRGVEATAKWETTSRSFRLVSSLATPAF